MSKCEYCKKQDHSLMCYYCKKYYCNKCATLHECTCIEFLQDFKCVNNDGLDKLREEIGIQINKFNTIDKIDSIENIIKYIDSPEFRKQDDLVQSLILKGTNRDNLLSEQRNLDMLLLRIKSKHTLK